jgi:3-oxoacyl-[acyl-carrier-protein] synthase II
MAPDTDPIVITGMGAVSPLGIGVAANWQALLDGRSGIVMNDRFDVSDFAAKIAGLVPKSFDPTTVVDPKDIKKMDLFIQYGLVAAAEALAQSGWVADTADKQAVTATIIGSGVGGSPVMAEAVNTIRDKGPRRLSPFTVPAFLANLAAGWISIKYGFKGPIGAP